MTALKAMATAKILQVSGRFLRAIAMGTWPNDFRFLVNRVCKPIIFTRAQCHNHTPKQ